MNVCIGVEQIPLITRKGEYNSAHLNERAIEVPIGKWFLDRYPNLIELGAVLPYYYECIHSVYDLNDEYKHSLKIDFSHLDLDFTGKDVLSISTIEHVGFNDYSKAPFLGSPEMPLSMKYRYDKCRWGEGFKCIEKIMAEAANFLITIPLGFNPTIDEMLGLLDESKYFVIKRINKGNLWRLDLDKSLNYKYGSPFKNANALCVITNNKELLCK